jgi:DNA-binding CsgD family transcriptional regulator
LDTSVASLLDQIRDIQDEDDLDAFVCRLKDYFGTTHCAFFVMAPGGGVSLFGTFPKAWSEEYFTRGMDRHDPIIMACYNSHMPVNWQDLDWSSRQSQIIYQVALSNGLGPQGYTVPIRGPRGQYAALSLCGCESGQEWREKWQRLQVDVLTICHFLNARVLEMCPKTHNDPYKGLSPREVDAMSFLARGLSRAQIAETLRISEHTLRAYIESARRKLDAANTTHAVAKAISHGFILV